jgi:hypothetical protein
MILNKSLVMAAVVTVAVVAILPAPAAAADAGVESPTDHAAVVGHWGIGYLGSSQVSVLSGRPDESDPFPLASVDLHTLGVRYWMSSRIGLELGAAVGAGLASNSTTTGNTTKTEDSPGYMGFEVQAGLPFLLTESRHLAFNVAPFVSYRRASSNLTVTTDGTAVGTKVTDQTLQAGANLTAEWQFGFIGLPELGLQASVGAQVVRHVATVSLSLNDTVVSEVSSSTTRLGTSVGPGADVAGQLTGHLAAIWYFGAGR